MVDWDTILKEEHMEDEATNPQASAPAGNAAAAAAPIPIDTAKTPDPHPGFDTAVSHLQFGGFSHETAKAIINHVGIDTVLQARENSGSRPPVTMQPAPTAPASLLSSLAPSGADPAGGQKAEIPSNEVIKEANAPEAGSKRCKTCGIWYPGGYERCPNDNTQL